MRNTKQKRMKAIKIKKPLKHGLKKQETSGRIGGNPMKDIDIISL